MNILELGMLGTGVPSALGATLGNPDREVVCVTGDGAAGFNFMEMQSGAREGAKLTTIVFAEGLWSMEVPNEQMLYGRNFGTEMGAIRWDMVAQALGCTGFHAESMAEVEAALAKARAVKGPVVRSLTFTTLLSVVPLLAVSFAMFTRFPIFSRFEAAHSIC